MITSIPTEKIYDGRDVPCSVKHGVIIQRALDLPVSDFFVLLNDHDPAPLRYQFNAEYPGQFSWEYVQRGPDVFAVKILRLKSA